MKKIFAVTMSVVLFFGILVGCTSKSATNDTSSPSTTSNKEVGTKAKDVTLTVFNRYPQEPYKSFFDKAGTDFEKQNPNVKIKFVNALNDDYKQKINVQLSSSTPPDIFFSWGGEYGQKYVRSKLALDLTDYIKKDTQWSDQIISSQFSAYTVDKHIYGIPVYTDAKVLLYNQDIFDKLKLTAPKTWDELIAVSKTLKENGYNPIAFGDQSNWAVGHYIGSLNTRFVPKDVLKKDYDRTGGQFTDPGYIEALKKLQELIPYFTPQTNAVTDQDAGNTFLSQKSAMYYNETIGFADIIKVAFKWSFINFPEVTGGKGDQKSIAGAPEGFMISSKTENPEMAMKFLEFLTSKEVAAGMVKATSWNPVVKGVLTSENASPQSIEAQKTIEAASDMDMWLDTAIDSKIVDPYLSGGQKLLNGEMTPEQVMKSVQDAANEVRKSPGN